MPEQHLTDVSRRILIAMASAGLLSSSVRARRAVPMISVPIVDALQLLVVTDAATFGPFLPDIAPPGMRVERAGNGGGPTPRMLPHPLLAEFGLSILGTSRRAGEERNVLVDFGYSREVLSNNLALLGVSPDSVDAAVLSHGHLDHYGGFAGLRGADVGTKRDIPLTVGGEEVFCERVALVGNPPPLMGALDRPALLRAGYDVRIAPAPTVIADQAFTTGVIPLKSFERAAIPTRMRPGAGCDRAALAPAKRDIAELADDGEHELATCYAVRGLGLVIIASCSHRGVVNSVRRAQEVSGIDKVHAVIGGFHLVRPRTEEEARRTVAEFALIDPTYIIPMHCTGEVFIAEALRLMPQKVVLPYVGTRFLFSAA